MNTQTMFSSNSDDWATPQDLFDKLDAEFTFTLDPCASELNAKCKKYYTIIDNGLTQDWEGNVFVNPPYGRQIGAWIQKAYKESLNGSTVVCLIPSRTDTRWWHDYVSKAHEVRFIRGRLKFGGNKNSAPFPSAIVIFKNGGLAV